MTLLLIIAVIVIVPWVAEQTSYMVLDDVPILTDDPAEVVAAIRTMGFQGIATHTERMEPT